MEDILHFLKALKKNNNREWFEKHKPDYLKAKTELESTVNKLLSGLKKFDKAIANDLEAKDCIFRIYKDVRFSKDKSPYKTNMGASMNPGGRKSPIPGYYLHIEPGNSFVAGGAYMPEPSFLNAIRQEIDYNGDDLQKIFDAKKFRSVFDGLDPIDVLKTVPKGYAKDHKYINYLKHKHFIVTKDLSDQDVSSSKLETIVLDHFKTMVPFLEFLREAMPK